MADQQELLDALQAQMEDPNAPSTPEQDQKELESDVDQADAPTPPSNPILAQIAASQSQGAKPDAAQPPATPPAPAAQSDSDRLGNAQQGANKQAFLSNLLRSFQGALSASSHGNYKADNSVANAMDENSKQNLNTTKEQIGAEAANRKEGRDAEMHKIQMDEFQQKLAKSKLDFQDMQANQDPTSGQSKLAQDRVMQMQKEMDQPVNEEQIRSMNGATLFKYFPYLQQDLAKHYQVQQWEDQREQQSKENEANRQYKDKALNEQINSRKDLMGMANQGKLDVAKEKVAAAKKAADDKQVASLSEKMKKDIDPNKSRYGNMASEQGKVVQATHLQSLLKDSGGNINNLPAAQVEETAIGLNKLISGVNGGADRQVQALVPHSIIGDAQKLKAWLINEPQGANQQAFLKYMSDSVDRQGRVAADNVKKAQMSLAGSGAYKKLKELDPDTFNQNLTSFYLDPEELDEKGQYKPKGGPTPQGGASVGPYGETTEKDGKQYKWNPDANKYQLLGQ